MYVFHEILNHTEEDCTVGGTGTAYTLPACWFYASRKTRVNDITAGRSSHLIYLLAPFYSLKESHRILSRKELHEIAY
jgi:hypothetical protein